MFIKIMKRILFLVFTLVFALFFSLMRTGWTQENAGNDVLEMRKVLDVAETAEVTELSLSQKAFYYVRAVQNYDQNMRRLKRERKPWENYGVRTPADYLYALVSTERFFYENPQHRVDFTSERVFPPKACTELLALIREMQELSDDSPFQGNFRWYWGQDTVVDRNAVEFVMQRLLFCWKYRDLMPKSWEKPMREILTSAAPEVLRRTVNPEYTNIAVLNFSNLILLGEMLDQPTLVEEGIRRMERFTFYTWKNGIHEFSSQTYYATTLEGLEQLWDLSTNRRVKEKVILLLDYWFYSIALHYRPDGNWDRKCAGKLVGATSRTYNYMYGDQYLGYHLGALGWNKLPPEASNITIVTALNTSFRPPRYYGKMWKWSAEQLPISIVERWGESQKQYRKTWVTEDFSFGTAGKEYGSFQDQLWLLDWHENLTENTDKNQKRNTRSYFIPDGRSDPWGTAREVTNGGHRKALHLNPAWSAVQNGPFARCRVVYDAELVKKFQNERPDGRITSVWVLKYPDSYEITGTATENAAENATENGDLPRLRLRYGKYELCLTLENVRNGQVAEELIPSPDGNAVAWVVAHDVKTGMET
ncbi:MAG: hypothetical protein Q4C70_14405, partial [Planctomycetia bacterium]|nr:hypothetical protein [Planctomycetia bacterium]